MSDKPFGDFIRKYLKQYTYLLFTPWIRTTIPISRLVFKGANEQATWQAGDQVCLNQRHRVIWPVVKRDRVFLLVLWCSWRSENSLVFTRFSNYSVPFRGQLIHVNMYMYCVTQNFVMRNCCAGWAGSSVSVYDKLNFMHPHAWKISYQFPKANKVRMHAWWSNIEQREICRGWRRTFCLVDLAKIIHRLGPCHLNCS